MPPDDIRLDDTFCINGIYFTGYELLKELDMIEEYLLEKPGQISDKIVAPLKDSSYI